MALEKEIWKDAIGYEGYYKVSNFGRVKSIKRTIVYKNGYIRTVKARILKLTLHKKGYLQVGLSMHCINHIEKVHQLIANVFIPEVNGKNQINHKDGIKSNNYATNLERCNNSENQIHSYLVLKRKPVKHNPIKNEYAKPVLQYSKRGVLIARFNSIADASRNTKIYTSGIADCCKNRYKTGGGFIWKFGRKRTKFANNSINKLNLKV